MRDSLVLWNLVNYNDKITNLNFREIKVQHTVREYFINFIFDFDFDFSL